MKDRNMYYQNYNAGGFTSPQFNQQYYPNMFYNQQMPPSGFNVTSQMEAFGPNLVPEQLNGFNGYNNQYDNNIEQRIAKLEKQIKNVDARVQKLESSFGEEENENIYMI